MDAASTITIVIQSVALIFGAGAQYATLRQHAREITDLKKAHSENTKEISRLNVKVGKLEVREQM